MDVLHALIPNPLHNHFHTWGQYGEVTPSSWLLIFTTAFVLCTDYGRVATERTPSGKEMSVPRNLWHCWRCATAIGLGIADLLWVEYTMYHMNLMCQVALLIYFFNIGKQYS